MKAREIFGIIFVVIGALIISNLFKSIYSSILSIFSVKLIIGLIFVGAGIWIFKGTENQIEERRDQPTKKKRSGGTKK